MAQSTSEYHHGDQDISEQISSFHLFNNLTKWGSLIIGDAILMLAMIFCARTGVIAGLVTFAVVMALGIFFLRSKPHDEEI